MIMIKVSREVKFPRGKDGLHMNGIGVYFD